ncbi:MAG: Chemotaxis protein CheC -- inhibitor of MCP methylation [Candidatus Ozemobacter sibiricus]|uniref:Chemotaxis protein CheC--inhibitor of MCP methylation n=1 Tax=Candidatus Ozemobacter sibiricus TaxID=2268124 RepID=A0A367ZIF9_9BACT|nr:MAG: Chemotaxis protein CheC -- inhibitor of MCP methylation [Candidatus Ozemobacter sibiricus]
MDDVLNLTKRQLDALRELGNIGSGNAATALAQFLNRKIDMDVPSAKILPLAEVSGLVGGPEQQVLGIFLKVMGQLSGRFILLVPTSTAIKLLQALMPGFEINFSNGKFGEMETSCMREVGNILAGSFLNALSVLTRVPMLNSLPSMAIDMAGALLDSVISDMAAVSDHVLMIETAFVESQENLRIHIFLLPDPASLDRLLEILGVK